MTQIIAKDRGEGEAASQTACRTILPHRSGNAKFVKVGSGAVSAKLKFFDHLRLSDDNVSAAVESLLRDLVAWLHLASRGEMAPADQIVGPDLLSQPVQAVTLTTLLNASRALPPLAQSGIDIGIERLLGAIRQRLIRAGASAPLADAEAALLMSELFGSILLARVLSEPKLADHTYNGGFATGINSKITRDVN